MSSNVSGLKTYSAQSNQTERSLVFPTTGMCLAFTYLPSKSCGSWDISCFFQFTLKQKNKYAGKISFLQTNLEHKINIYLYEKRGVCGWASIRLDSDSINSKLQNQTCIS